ncbi:MAG: M23 family metallopeptidase [Cyanobacteria bacterium P01_C01_bin.120]
MNRFLKSQFSPKSSPSHNKKVYSSHYRNRPAPPVEAMPSPLPLKPLLSQGKFSKRRRSLVAVATGLLSLLAIVVGGTELWRSPTQVEAQVTEAAVAGEASNDAAIAPAVSTPWQSASFPVENFLAYTSPFGYRQHPYGGRRFHYGLDIAAPMGSYIRAWWEGTVIEVSDDTACGTSIVIESHGWLHIYCHMQGHVVIEKDGDRWLVDHDGGVKIRQGDWVPSGWRIGRIGMTGRTTGPHLHWGLKYQDSWVDPSVIIKAMNES